MSNSHSIQFCVFPSPETNDFEVQIFVNGQNLIEKHWPDMMGMDPEEVLSLGVLAPRDTPHVETVVRCGCGVVGCGSVTVTIHGEGNRVIWDTWGNPGNPPAGPLVFERGHYLRALEQAVSDKSWESPDRTAARLLSSMVDREALAAHDLSFQRASGRLRDDTFTVSLGGPPGYYQILVHIPWSGELPEEISRKTAEVLRKHPSQWPDVWWFGQSPTPPFEGPGWANRRVTTQAT